MARDGSQRNAPFIVPINRLPGKWLIGNVSAQRMHWGLLLMELFHWVFVVF